MQFTLTTACLLTTALASPLFGTTSNLKYPAAPLTDVACKLSQAITPGTPLVFLFPAANKLGTVVGPVLRGAIGAENVEKLDALADYLCINSQEEPARGRGLCAEILQATKYLVNAGVPATQAGAYKCLLNLVCVANSGPDRDGTCQYLLSGSDCVANRIIQGKDLECE